MSDLDVFTLGENDAEMCRLQHELQRAASSPALGAFDMISPSILSEPAPPVPRKSSRRNLRVTIYSETAPSSTVEPSESSSSSPRPRSSYESTPTTATSDDTLEHAVDRFENCHLEKLPPRYDDMPMLPHKNPTRRRSRGSSTSSRTYSDSLPEYQVEFPAAGLVGPNNALTLTAQEKQALKEAYKDPEADAEVEREESVYDLPTVDEIPEQESELDSPQSTDGKTLHILAKGLHPMSFRMPQKELNISITNDDSSVAYTATRAKRTDANFTMSTPGSGTILSVSFHGAATVTPLHSDSIEGVLEPFTITGKGTKHSQSFRLPSSPDREFEWRYSSTTGKECLELVESHLQDQQQQAKKLKSDTASIFSRRSSMLMRRLSTFNPSRANGSKAKQCQPPSASKVLAQLIRFDKSGMTHGREWRGTSRPGNGGQLVLEPSCIDMVPEEVVVATALVMLKREQDRLRSVQASFVFAGVI